MGHRAEQHPGQPPSALIFTRCRVEGPGQGGSAGRLSFGCRVRPSVWNRGRTSPRGGAPWTCHRRTPRRSTDLWHRCGKRRAGRTPGGPMTPRRRAVFLPPPHPGIGIVLSDHHQRGCCPLPRRSGTTAPSPTRSAAWSEWHRAAGQLHRPAEPADLHRHDRRWPAFLYWRSHRPAPACRRHLQGLGDGDDAVGRPVRRQLRQGPDRRLRRAFTLQWLEPWRSPTLRLPRVRAVRRADVRRPDLTSPTPRDPAAGDEMAGRGSGSSTSSAGGAARGGSPRRHARRAVGSGLRTARPGAGSPATCWSATSATAGSACSTGPAASFEPARCAARHGRPLVIDGLWALLPGTATTGGTDSFCFSAGPNDETHGLLGGEPW